MLRTMRSFVTKRGLECVHDVGGRVVYRAEYRPYGEPLCGAGFVERYVKGELNLHLHAMTRNGTEASQLCAIVQRPEPRPTDQLNDVLRITEEPQAEIGDVQRSVFVYVPQFVEQPERVQVWLPVVSSVGLRGLEECLLCWSEPAN